VSFSSLKTELVRLDLRGRTDLSILKNIDIGNSIDYGGNHTTKI